MFPYSLGSLIRVSSGLVRVSFCLFLRPRVRNSARFTIFCALMRDRTLVKVNHKRDQVEQSLVVCKKRQVYEDVQQIVLIIMFKECGQAYTSMK